MGTTARTTLHVGAVTTVAWAESVFIDPIGGLFNTWLVASLTFALIFLLIFVPLALVTSFRTKNYRYAYWVAFIPTAIWSVVLGPFGTWYAVQHTK
jgi:hypothetical protein